MCDFDLRSGCLPLFLAGLLSLVPLAGHAEAYRLHAQDRLLIRMLTWEFNQSNQVAWDKLSGEYSITPEGQLLLPLAGPIDVAGMTVSELSQAASELLRRAVGMDEPIKLSVELMSSIPVFVMGAVQTRGAVEFHPGLTARQALALAGDMYRLPATNDAMRAVALTGDVLAGEDRLRRLRHEETLVRDELATLSDRQAQPADPVPMSADSDVQTRLLEADREGRRTRAASLASLEDLLVSKIDRLKQQMVLRDQQIATATGDLRDVESLKDKGLAANARVTALSTNLNDLEAKRLELETTLLLTEQQLNQAQRDSGTIQSDALTQLLQRLSELQAEIPAEEIKLSTARQLQTQTLMGEGTQAQDDAATPPVFTVIRTSADGTVRIRVQPDAALSPGDTLEVTLPTLQQIATSP